MATQTASNQQNEAYFMSRDAMASARLTLQHQSMVARQGYILHPSIISALDLSSESLSDDRRPVQILDLGTGNGIWVIDLNASLTSSKRPFEITGLDISDAQFPPKQSWPANTTFATYDIFSDPPEQYTNKFDVIHIKLIMSVLIQNETRKEVVISNVRKMLKPGGYLQWTEPPAPTYSTLILPPNADGTCAIRDDEHLDALVVMDKYLPIQTATLWGNQLDEFVARHGFTDVKAHWAPMRFERVKYEADLSVWSLEETAKGVLKLSEQPEHVQRMLGWKGPGLGQEGRKEILEAIQNTFGELQRGEKLIGMRILTVVGKMV
ncbi:hypothetical protein PMZ80_011090 [Knufia obscura]|uniref:Methyltransferase domain-containing protein n=1 Tax=Knufia obscura TaxID=1635080 RepID=A0ABR0R7M1_9EURO|nr:hypothetical protein PMZ80_011090 [Knufia obscura]